MLHVIGHNLELMIMNEKSILNKRNTFQYFRPFKTLDHLCIVHVGKQWFP
jgi:hypothetical protein